MKNFGIGLTLASAILLTGCASNKSLYSWGPYESEVYSYLRGESPEEQVVKLEKHLTDMQSKNGVAPPGFYAHLGLLYSKTGRQAEVASMFEKEKALYPESAVFINNIMNGFKVAK